MSSRSLETEDRVEKKDGVLGSPRQKSGESFVSPHSGKRQLPKVYRHRDSLLPLRWRLTHSIRWKVQMLSAELSLIAFILLLVMVFSKRWLCLSMVRFYQRWPASVSNRIHTSVHIMSMGLLHICIAKNCPNSENGKVTLIFSTLMLFPINVWIFEWKRNLSVPIGWTYFIGWVVLFLHATCAILCYFNNKNFWSLILSCSIGTMPCGSSTRPGPLSEQIVSDISVN
ncbi:PREDICTED: outer dense fiber protein 4 [Miniopterus natalensis]|uniref:outer dense fiber protein 4 n=1 Tax=Miniopterus natalensis TaxID=291302 RepID=UPI0007A6E441|nr:PREDICTED: outer dense fiber protein 4 [Miniopterus natalensis]